MKTCTVEGCNRAHRARGLCTTHYNQAHQPSRHAKVETRCTNCGATTLKHKSGDRLPFCDYTCRDLYSIENKRGPWSREAAPKPKREPRDLRSPLRKALEDGDRDGVIAAVRGHSDMRPDGCWEWKRSFKDYYPIVVICGKQKYVHRLTLEAKMGKPLGKQPAHHTCANSFCVNPDHLQPVTARENVAEMLARRYMEGRIADLESALRTLDPTHPLLAEVGVISPAA